ncbi:MAG TPA: hypothetical protein VFN50_10375 [Acidimicrobiales bacterium]|nr:hypothetical protein [Acidimicrobiales bacterium]
MSFDQLVSEGRSVPLEGFDFSWFEGRASEERPPWGYASLLARRAGEVTTMCDLETGGGEVLAWSLGQAVRRPANGGGDGGLRPERGHRQQMARPPRRRSGCAHSVRLTLPGVSLERVNVVYR